MGSENEMVAVPGLASGYRAVFDRASAIVECTKIVNSDPLAALARLAQPDAQQGASSPASGEGVAIPAGMKPWHGGDAAPNDLDLSGLVLREDGQTEAGRDTTVQQWKRPIPRCKWNIIAYTPLAAATQPAVPQEGWQPIETAPTAGGFQDERILVWGPKLKEPDLVLPDGDWWRIRKATAGEYLFTHWMPLPSTAALTGAGENGEQGA